MKSRRLKNLDRSCLIILAAVALGGALWTAGAIVRHEHRLLLEKEQRTHYREKLTKAELNRKALEQALGRVGQELAGLQKRIPQKTDMGALLRQLNLRMKERRITMATIQPQAAVPDELYVKIPIRLVFQGTFQQSYLFLCDLETMDQLVVPEKVTIIGLEPPKECQVDLTVLVFERKTAGSGV